MTDEPKPILVDDCPCVQTNCPMYGDCVACVRAHRIHKRHAPECMQPIFRDLITELAEKVELKVSEGRPDPEA